MSLVLDIEFMSLAKQLKMDGPFDEARIIACAQRLAYLIDEAPKNSLGGLEHATIHLETILVKQGEVYLPDQRLAALLIKKEERLCDSFLSPEQKASSTRQIQDQSSDSYAFGVLIYYLLMGHFPEGFFPWPEHPGFCQLLKSCLSFYPEARPKSLKDAVAALLTEAPKPLLRPEKIERPQYDADPGAIFQKEISIGKYQPQEKEEGKVEPLLTEMRIIPAGSFFRGSNCGGRDESPRHLVYLDSFALDIHPVTNDQFVRFLEMMGGEKDVNNNDIIRLRESRIKRAAGRLHIESGYAKHPVVGVTWYGATAYAKWVGKRLPTEAEWEVAALGAQEDALYPTGQTIDRPQANFFSSDTTPIKSYNANSYGLFDMAGNVYEWCYDWYDNHYYTFAQSEPNNPRGPQQGIYRVLRGGCWKSSKEDLRCAHRHRNNPGTLNGTYGFRCAADVF